MARKKRPSKAHASRVAAPAHPSKGGARYLQLPAKWYRYYVEKARAFEDEGDPLEAQLLERKRLLEEAYLKDSIKILRKYAKGFTAADGFDLNKIALIPESRLKKVRKYAPLIREEIASPHVEARPRSAASRAALEKHTGQTDLPGRKVFTVFTDQPERTKVKLVPSTEVVRDKLGRKRKVHRAQVEVERQVTGGRVTDRFYYLPEPPSSFEDIIDQTRKLLRFMPRGWYVLVTSTHGNIAAPMRKDQILQQLHDRYLVYDKVPPRGTKDNRGLAEVVVGFKMVSFTQEGAEKEYNERLTRREIAERERRALRAKQRKQALRRLRGLKP